MNIVENIYNEHIVKKYKMIVVYNKKISQKNICIDDEKINEKNLTEYLKLYTLKESKLKYYEHTKKCDKYIYWMFRYDGHQNFYILFEIETKHYYLIMGGGDCGSKYCKFMKVGDVDLDDEGRYWMDIYKSQYLEDILNLIE